MAGQPSVSTNQRHLSPAQQDLLIAAFNSQASGRQPSSDRPASQAIISNNSTSAIMNGTSANGLFMSPANAELDSFDADYTPDLDYLDGDANFDFENADLGGDMIGSLPGGSFDSSEYHEKRKLSDEQDFDEEGDPKRQETQDGERGGKKPGRKPLTNEPTTKRKAQNRAAQRAFRERKEKHLKDLETKVADLSKAQEADKHENGLLKAQVDRLQTELREYRKRLSLTNASGGAARSSPPLNAYDNQQRSSSGSNPGANNFNFDFPKFGGLPGSQILANAMGSTNTSANGPSRNGSNSPTVSQSPSNRGSVSFANPAVGQVSRSNSNVGRSASPQSLRQTTSNTGSPAHAVQPNAPISTYSSAGNMHGFAETLPQMGNGDALGELFSPSILKSVAMENMNYFANSPASNGSGTTFEATNGGDTTAGLNRVFQFNGGSSASDSASPSNSSSSQWNANANSSCGTSPEPSHGSPGNKGDKAPASFQQQPVLPRNDTSLSSFSNGPFDSNIDFSVPSAAGLDPTLFGDYRDTSGLGPDFSTGFFDDALNQPFDLGSPSNLFGILQSPQQTSASLNPTNTTANAPTPSRALMEECDKTRDGGDDDYGLPETKPKKPEGKSKLISCNNIWNQLQSNPEFQSGTFDLDSLCSELRVKARCSESGVMVDQDHVDAAIKKLTQKSDSGKYAAQSEVPPLMFEQESWDNVLKKLGNKP